MRKVVTSGIGLIVLVCISLIFASCNKYEDGPVISLRSAENRITGNFAAYKFYIDGSSEIKLWGDSICSTRINFDPSTGRFDVAHKSGMLKGAFKLIDNEKNLSMFDLEETDEYPGYGPFKEEAVSSWTIKKLTNKETWIETDFETKHYTLMLTRQ